MLDSLNEGGGVPIDSPTHKSKNLARNGLRDKINRSL